MRNLQHRLGLTVLLAAAFLSSAPRRSVARDFFPRSVALARFEARSSL